MKKFFLGFAAFTLISTSCSQNEVAEDINQDSAALKFGAITGNLSSRAAEVAITDLQTSGIDLFALITADAGATYAEYFTDKLTYTAGTPSSWAPGSKRYLKEGFKNEFYSIHPAQTDLTAAKLATDGAKFTYAVKAGATEDLLGAAAKEDYKVSTDGNGVPVIMPFKHLLAQANFGVAGVEGMGNVKVSNIKFNNVGASGTYAFANAAWSATTLSAYLMTGAEIDTKTDAQTPALSGNYILDRATYSLMLVPAAFATSTITFDFQAYDLAGVEVTNGVTKGTIDLDATVTANTKAAWMSGLRYVYLLDFANWFANRELKFSVSLSDWENYDWNDVEGAGDGIVTVEK